MSALAVLRYRAVALQLRTQSVSGLPDRSSAREQILRNIAHVDRAVGAACRVISQWSGQPLQLVVLPEYALTGAPGSGSIAAWRDHAALSVAGEEFAALAQTATRHGVFLAGNAYEADAHFPELYFQTSFILDPAGSVVLRYRRLISLHTPTPYDVWDRYLERYGLEGVFPVADTSIGRLAAIASEEILYPEIARCHALRGAEVFVHSTSEMGSPQATAKDMGKRARAAENLAYVISANAAGVDGTALPANSSTGMSKIVNSQGQVIAEAPPGGETCVAHAELDIGALRGQRRRTGHGNLLTRQPLQAYAASYQNTVFRPANGLAAAIHPRDLSGADLRRLHEDTIERLARLGLL